MNPQSLFQDDETPCPFCGHNVFFSCDVTANHQPVTVSLPDVQYMDWQVKARLCTNCAHIDFFAPTFRMPEGWGAPPEREREIITAPPPTPVEEQDPPAYILDEVPEADPMEDGLFWSVIESAEGEYGKVRAALERLSAEEIDAWDRAYWEKHSALHCWAVWGAAFIVRRELAVDHFDGFKAWIVGKGKEFYKVAVKNPDLITPLITEGDESKGYDGDSLNYAAGEAYEWVAGRDLPNRSAEATELAGTPWNESDLPSLFPRLWRKYGK